MSTTVQINSRPDPARRRLLMAVLAGLLAGMPRLAAAQSMDSDAIGRTIRSLRHWWSRLNREPDAGDEDAKDTRRFVSATPPAPRSWSAGGITIAWIGHSTFLINLEGTLILTDPIFSQKAGVRVLGVATIGLPRIVPPALPLADLPRPDLVLVSHAHMDHYDLPTLRRLPADVPVIMARDTGEFIGGRLQRLRELDWGESAEVDGVRVEALPVRHWGARYPWDRERGYNGLLLTKHNRTILFAGDTALTDRLPAALRGRRPEVAMLPIGGYDPYIYSHASPEQAWDLFRAMEASYLVPMHWRTFRLSHERPFEPYERLSTAGNGTVSRIALHAIGQTWTLPA